MLQGQKDLEAKVAELTSSAEAKLQQVVESLASAEKANTVAKEAEASLKAKVEELQLSLTTAEADKKQAVDQQSALEKKLAELEAAAKEPTKAAEDAAPKEGSD